MAGVENVENSSTLEFLIGEPLDTMQIKVNGKNGIQQIVPALNIGFMEVRGYVYFKPVPVITDDTGQDGLTAEEEEWLESVSFLEDDLHWLLRLPHHRFWSQVVYEEDMHKCLESYLTLSPRDYDLVNMKMKNEIRSALNKIHRLVFLVFLRMSTFKESKEHHIRPKAFGNIIYDNFVFDVPKLMDLCVLYGFQNKAILTKMITNIFSAQPRYTEDLTETCNFVLHAFMFAEEKLFLNANEKQGDCRRLDEQSFTDIREMPLSSFCDIISYITDASATIYMFLEIYSPACEVFRQNGAINRITSFYERMFPAIENKIKKFQKRNEDSSVLDCVKKKVALSKTFLVKTFRNILSYCCIQHILDPSCAPEKSLRIAPSEEFIEIFTDIASEKTFLHDYNSVYPFENDMEIINATGAYVDIDRLSYVFDSIHNSLEFNPQTFTSTAENGARPKTHSRTVPTTEVAIKSLQDIGAILKPKSSNSLQNGVPSLQSADSRPSEYQLDSLIDSVLDVLPDLGEGFIEESLEYYGYDHEKFINAILTDSLPPSLDTLDRQMKRKPPVMDRPALNEEKPSVLAERRNIFDNDEFDLFSRSDVNMENIHIGKKNKTPSSYQNLQSEKESEFLKHLICTYGDQESDDEYDRMDSKINLYEDEYDDTYDSTLVGVKEPFLENEPEKEEPVEKEQIVEESSEETRDTSLDFCENPEKVRQAREERWQSKMAARNKGNAPVHENNSNRQNKERNKAHAGNHNRRKQSDYKKSRGMMPFPTR